MSRKQRLGGVWLGVVQWVSGGQVLARLVVGCKGEANAN